MAGIESLLNGRLLAGRYRVAEVIGRGGFAAVYRADHERLHRTVAVKVITAAAADSEALGRMRARLHREAQAAARLRHPNVVTVYDFGTDPEIDLDFLVVELLQGEDLAARIAREGVPPLDQALRILQEAAEGVAAGHLAAHTHRQRAASHLGAEVDAPGHDGAAPGPRAAPAAAPGRGAPRSPARLLRCGSAGNTPSARAGGWGRRGAGRRIAGPPAAPAGRRTAPRPPLPGARALPTPAAGAPSPGGTAPSRYRARARGGAGGRITARRR